ncbi:hypothetical protein TanjilG_04634 [Lupinus angustifolius]|uniref:DUF4378 domain-containing protein n=2 Tax=Lupinus angustifolius TaxID=3871 RepID=A0A1J7H5A4_LUPAN|nr:hypothetical protein TanjilG_04634 [Lupinus angustifolius]
MSKEKDTKHNPPNLVAKLMGLEAFPSGELNLAIDRSQKNYYSQNVYGFHSGSPLNKEISMLHEVHHASPEQVSYRDIYEKWVQNSQRTTSHVRGKTGLTKWSEEDVDGKKMALVHQNFMEAKRMLADERLRRSTQFSDALEVLSSNSDLLIKLMDELHCASTPLSETNNINLLKPLKIVDNDNAGMKNKNDEKHYSCSASKEVEEFRVQSTRIVVLKPSSDVSPTTLSTRNFQSGNFYERPETLYSSLFSNRGDESSCNKPDHDDFEAMSTFSMHSLDTINGFGAGSYSPESSVYKEAKKRLSERWTIMASNSNVVQEQMHVKKSSTLGEMLSKKSVTSEVEGIIINEDQKPTKFVSCSDSSTDEEIRIHSSAKTLPMSSYVTGSSAVCETGLRVEVSDHDDAIIAHGSKVVKKSKSVKSSFKGKVMSFLFSRNKKPTKEKCNLSQSSVTETSVSSVNSLGLIRDDVFQSFNSFEECSLSSLCGSLNKTLSDSVSNGQQQGIITPEPGLSVSKTMVPEISSENQDQPSPISVLNPPFEDDNAAHDSFEYMKGGHLGSMMLLKTNVIDKSPPIESIVRTLSWNDSCSELASPYSFKPLMVSSLDSKFEGQELHLLVEKLLSTAGLDDQVQFNSFYPIWHSLESPLDPSLRDKYAYNLNIKDPPHYQPLYEAKRRKMRSNQKLVFDCVNAALLEMTSSHYGSEKYFLKSRMCSGTHTVQEGELCPYLMDHIVAQMKDLIGSEVRFVWRDSGDSNRLVVENVVRKEVVGIRWVELMELEIDILEREIERKLIQELVENVVADFTSGMA